jgi:UDP-glucose 6-dehydrogenase
MAEPPKRLTVIGEGHGGLPLTTLASEASYDVLDIDLDGARIARFRDDDLARPILGESGLNPTSEKSYPGAREAPFTLITAGARRATHAVVIRSDHSDVDYGRADRRVRGCRNRLTGPTVEFL